MTNLNIITYAENKKTITEALKIGIEEIILTAKKKEIINFANHARNINLKIILSYHFDFFLKDKDIPQIIKTLKILKIAKIAKIRIKDIGLLEIIKKYIPDAKIIFTNETVNLNSESVSAYAQFVDSQVLSHLLSLKELKQITSKCPSNFELLIQGQILLHHSPHKFIAKKAAFLEDTDHPLHLLPYKQNRHGFYLYNFYHRNLINYLSQLEKSIVSATPCGYPLGLIIDLRGYPLTYIKSALLAYKSALSHLGNKSPVRVAPRGYPVMIYPYPQKPGFFKSANFDYRPKSIYQEAKKTKKIYGQILDTLDKKWLVIETYFPVNIGDKFQIITPEDKTMELIISEIKYPAGLFLQKNKNNIIITRFTKFILNKSLIIK